MNDDPACVITPAAGMQEAASLRTQLADAIAEDFDKVPEHANV